MLYSFRDHLQSIKSEMTSLQERSLRMNTSLTNRKKLQKMLLTFVESAVLDKELIDAICLAPINEEYVEHIRALLQKLSKKFLTERLPEEHVDILRQQGREVAAARAGKAED